MGLKELLQRTKQALGEVKIAQVDFAATGTINVEHNRQEKALPSGVEVVSLDGGMSFPDNFARFMGDDKLTGRAASAELRVAVFSTDEGPKGRIQGQKVEIRRDKPGDLAEVRTKVIN